MAHCDLALMNSRRDSLRIKLLHLLYWISIELDRSGQYAPPSQVLERHIARLGKDCEIITHLRHSSAFDSSVDRMVNLRLRKGRHACFPARHGVSGRDVEWFLVVFGGSIGASFCSSSLLD